MLSCNTKIIIVIIIQENVCCRISIESNLIQNLRLYCYKIKGEKMKKKIIHEIIKIMSIRIELRKKIII